MDLIQVRHLKFGQKFKFENEIFKFENKAGEIINSIRVRDNKLIKFWFSCPVELIDIEEGGIKYLDLQEEEQ